MRTACFESASIERSSGVFLSSASPVQLTDGVGHRDVERLAVGHRASQRVIHRFGEAGLLDFVVEDETAKCLSRAWTARLFRFRYRPVADRADRVAERPRTHDLAPSLSALPTAHHIARLRKCALWQHSCNRCKLPVT